MKKKLEIACFSFDSAIVAESAGADRIELCQNYAAGGITPAHATIKAIKNKLNIPIHVIIRPRGGDFVYSTDELEQMKKDILFCKSQHIQGIVFGCLNVQNEIDMHVCKDIIDLAKPMQITFHRAIDYCENMESQIEILIALGVDKVLTSGTKDRVTDGLDVIKHLQEKFGKEIVIMPGGGIRSGNLEHILQETNAVEIHSAAMTHNTELCDADEIKKMKAILLRA